MYFKFDENIEFENYDLEEDVLYYYDSSFQGNFIDLQASTEREWIFTQSFPKLCKIGQIYNGEECQG